MPVGGPYGFAITGYNGAFIAGHEISSGFSFDYAPSMDYFAGEAVEFGGSIPFVGLDGKVGRGWDLDNGSNGTYGGFDLSTGGGVSAVKLMTIKTTLWKYSSD